MSRAIIRRVPHRLGDIEIGQAPFAGLGADQHSVAVLGAARPDAPFQLDPDGMALQGKVELATGRDAELPADSGRESACSRPVGPEDTRR